MGKKTKTEAVDFLFDAILTLNNREECYAFFEDVSTPGLRRSPGEWKGYPLQYSGLENAMDCIVHGVAQSRTRLKRLSSSSST